MTASLPLFASYPGTATLPHVSLVDAPTPVSRVPGALADGVGSLWVKHDDVTARAYGGNKVRKLEFTLGRGLREGRRAVLTFGALGSNHVLATAVHGAALGFDVHAVLTPQARTSYLAANVAADLVAGASLHPVMRAEDGPRQAATLRARLRERDGLEPLVLPLGGTTPEAEAGFVNAALELAQQVEAGALPRPDAVYVPVGSTGTAVGLAIGLAAAGLSTRVMGVRVIPADMVALDRVREIAVEAVALLCGLDESFPRLGFEDLRLELRDGYLGEGYAIPTPGALRASELARAAGLALETTYTAKALSALLDDARDGSLRDATVVFWNTYNSRPLPGGVTSRTEMPPDFETFVVG